MNHSTTSSELFWSPSPPGGEAWNLTTTDAPEKGSLMMDNIIFNHTLNSSSSSTSSMEICVMDNSVETITSSLVQMALLALYSITSVLSLAGNATVIAVQLCRVSWVRSTQAYTIRKYLVNLAAADLVIGVICLPFNYTDLIYGEWRHPAWLCPAVQWAQPMAVLVSAFTLSLIGVERALFALRPLSSLYRWLRTHNKLIIVLTWVVGGAYSYLLYGRARLVERFHSNGQAYFDCTANPGLTEDEGSGGSDQLHHNHQRLRQAFIGLNFVLSFAVPFVLLTVSYVAIMRRLMHRLDGLDGLSPSRRTSRASALSFNAFGNVTTPVVQINNYNNYNNCNHYHFHQSRRSQSRSNHLGCSRMASQNHSSLHSIGEHCSSCGGTIDPNSSRRTSSYGSRSSHHFVSAATSRAHAASGGSISNSNSNSSHNSSSANCSHCCPLYMAAKHTHYKVHYWANNSSSGKLQSSQITSSGGQMPLDPSATLVSSVPQASGTHPSTASQPPPQPSAYHNNNKLCCSDQLSVDRSTSTASSSGHGSSGGSNGKATASRRTSAATATSAGTSTMACCDIIGLGDTHQVPMVEWGRGSLNNSANLTVRSAESSETIKRRLKTIRMLLVVIALYCACWLPIKVFQLLFEFQYLTFCTRTQFDRLMVLYIACHWAAMAHSALNPIVYACMSANFRYDFWKLKRHLSEYLRPFESNHRHTGNHHNHQQQQQPNHFSLQNLNKALSRVAT